MMKSFLRWECTSQEICLEILFQNIKELHEKISTGTIPMEMYTEEILIVLIDIFNISVHNKYQIDIIEKIAALKSHWYKLVRMQEKKQRRAQKGLQTLRG